MVTVVSLALMGGICLLVFTGTVQLLKLSDLRALRTIRDTAPTPVASWRAGTGRRAAEGITDDGPAGPQVGPVSGERCTWYHVTLTRKPTRSWSDEFHEDTLMDFSAPGPPAFSDRSGRVVLDPPLFEDPSRYEPEVTKTTTLVHRSASPAALPAFVSQDLIRDLRRGESLQLTEVRLPYAREVYVLALPVGEPLTLVPNPQGVTVFTTDSREQVLARRRESIATARWISRGFGLTGLIVTAASTALLMYSL